MRLKAATTGWGKTYKGNKSKNEIIHRRKHKVRLHSPKTTTKPLSKGYSSSGIMIGNYTGPGA